MFCVAERTISAKDASLVEISARLVAAESELASTRGQLSAEQARIASSEHSAGQQALAEKARADGLAADLALTREKVDELAQQLTCRDAQIEQLATENKHETSQIAALKGPFFLFLSFHAQISNFSDRNASSRRP